MDYAESDGGVPDDVLDIRLMERFGWTMQELDDTDEARLFPALAAANISDAVRAVRAWLDAAGSGRKVEKPSAGVWKLWQTAQDAKRTN